MKILRCLFGTILVIATIICGGVLVMYSLYQPLQEGTLVLEGFDGEITITREKETGIAHIRADTIKNVFVGQGFAHAQTRLWQMEKTRRLITGTLSEIIGEKGIPLDEFSRTVGYYRSGIESSEKLTDDRREIYQAYCDGINHYIKGVSKSTTGKVWPLEFYALGIKEPEEWKVEHIMGFVKLISFNLSWNWNQELLREVFSNMHEDIQDLIEEIAPFTAEFSHNLVTIIDEEDLKDQGLTIDDTEATHA